ncbi:hypothetical protein BU23DRAFT_570231 [Bimuria novae-zelandiae CBS 107.79]|uniref:Uncharacterized protein n=1 Tax=Bimuria novae-zelandiae CBS 107.79 TaxID=1447943 RepID=A0A6A5V7H4_9PLEO|nr:hypothetical protein BU23DRAFT_570231 [Bimuria novae-zelandiae CBS 107.79]
MSLLDSDPADDSEHLKINQALMAEICLHVGDLETNPTINRNSAKAFTIFIWMLKFPSDPTDFLDAETPGVETPEVNQDFLDEHEAFARKLEQALDGLEQEYRDMGVLYHQIPLAIRADTPAVLALPKIDPYGLRVLKGVFEPHNPRTGSAFFKDWLRVETALRNARDVIASVDPAKISITMSGLCLLLDSVLYYLKLAAKHLAPVRNNMIKLKGFLEEARRLGLLHMRASGLVAADLGEKSSKEGLAYREWVLTFPEVAKGEVGWMEAEKVLRERGAAASMNWRNEYKGLGEAWEAEREKDGDKV